MASLVPKLKPNKVASLIYHDIFDYPLTKRELDFWQFGEGVFKLKKKHTPQALKNDEYFFLAGRERVVLVRKKRQRFYLSKLKLAQKSAILIAKVPSVLFVGITGSLAMQNAKAKDDIDLIVVTKKNTLWLSRLLVHLLLKTNGFSVRRFGENLEKDKLCLNMWLDEDDLQIDPSVFAAHELLQIVPLVNKHKTYEKLLATNSWHKKYWPNATPSTDIKQRNLKEEMAGRYSLVINLSFLLEPVAYALQHLYMLKHKTREEVTRTRAFFHPVDWEKKVVKKLTLRGLMLK